MVKTSFALLSSYDNKFFRLLRLGIELGLILKNDLIINSVIRWLKRETEWLALSTVR
jgi:hypothetical protein